MSEGEVYEREVEDGQLTVDESEAAKTACIIDPDTGGVYEYAQIQSDGTIDVDILDGAEVEVVVPSDDQFEGMG